MLEEEEEEVLDVVEDVVTAEEVIVEEDVDVETERETKKSGFLLQR